MRNKKLLFGLLALSAGSTLALRADPIPYAPIGTQNAANYTFTASGGEVDAYFAGASAAFTDLVGVGVYDVTQQTFTRAPGPFGLDNQPNPPIPGSLSIGTEFDMGSFNKGDTLVFAMQVNGGSTLVYSDPSLNGPYDNGTGVQHVYSTYYDSSTQLFPSAVPSGIYIGFEDLPGGGDFDYNDTTFVVTGVPDSASTLSLLGLGLTGIGLLRRRICA